jgi:hypothetical protein
MTGKESVNSKAANLEGAMVARLQNKIALVVGS